MKLKRYLPCLFCLSVTTVMILGLFYDVWIGARALGWQIAACLVTAVAVIWHATKEKREFARFVRDMEERYRPKIYDFGRVNKQRLRALFTCHH